MSGALATPDGACHSCGHTEGRYDPRSKTVTCGRCGLPWPEGYWREQA